MLGVCEQGEGVMAVTFIRSDLEFILQQIIIAERNAAGENLRDILPNVQVPFGLRTVDGTFNNLVTGQSEFGTADNLFPRLTDPVFRAAEAGTSYADPGTVIDSQPRTISNLIADQTANNPAAYATAFDPGADGILHTPDDVLKEGVEIHTSAGPDHIFGTADDTEVFFFPNLAPDVFDPGADGIPHTADDLALSAPFNPWFTFFGQFFDHGLDLVTKGGNEIVFIPLMPDDPLYIEGSPTNFMVMTRATVFHGPGADGILGTGDDTVEHENTTSPFVDQNQTYTSHHSHQVFLPVYELGADGQPHATGKLITNRNLGGDGNFGTPDDVEIGGMATWAVVKAQARDILGINLTDADFDNVPLLATDAYGNYIRGEHGFPQVVMKGPDGLPGTTDDFMVEGNPLAPVDLTDAVRTGHQFLIDIAHNAVPVFDALGNLAPDDGDEVGNAQAFDPLTGANLTYDDELLDAHYIAGDGRVNENIGLTAVHSIFHSEHNRLVDHTKEVALATGDLAFLSQWLMPGTAPATFPITPEAIGDLQWNGERLFQA